ncbi:hypothetical protein B0A69_21425 [Chryseobacterium shigense]|uniref:Uncharacterized protein n=1 Tax=Chryseobacterium shigense TaxID=297244 RepID=A0A1N7IJ25_9FLAO|nr:hypothetical protein [Chryseobacterium shigense]PQA89984.1 hypothetical protein B0A69_21425 [Chryseobacterium shigense]SIS37077.1 hypothetical protein SAMN05421639_10414 [Chryseobacterium shigense]
MKRVPFSLLFLLTNFAFTTAQSGINTPSPSSTLDISAKNSTGTSTDTEGLLVPRVDRQRAQSMTPVPVSTLIYVNNIATGTLTGTAARIDSVGYYYFDGTVWSKLVTSLNIYNYDGMLSDPRIVTTNGNLLSFINGVNNVKLVTSATQAALSANGSSRGWLNLAGGSANLDYYVNNTGIAQLVSFGTSTQLSIGSTNASPLVLKTNGTDRITILSNGNTGVGTSTPNTKLEISSGTAHISGTKLTNLTSLSPISTGQTLGVDAAGNVITVANPTPASVTTASVNSTTGASFNVNDTTVIMVPGTSQTVAIPTGGKALFINFMLGIDYGSNPAGSGASYYEARLYIDGAATDCYMRTQEYGPGGFSAQFSFNTVKFLAAGNHTIDVRMTRTFNNGVASGVNMLCIPISMSFNATYLN